MEHKNQKKKYKANLTDIAYHEAGHVVTGYLLYKVNGVKIESGEIMGLNSLGAAQIDLPEDIYLGGAENPACFVNYIRIIICMMSGRYFQHKVSRHDDFGGAELDEKTLSCFLVSNEEYFYYPLANLGHFITKDFCSDLRVEKMVEVIARALMKKKSLDKDEIEELMKELKFDPAALLEEIKNTYYQGFMMAWKKLLADLEKSKTLASVDSRPLEDNEGEK